MTLTAVSAPPQFVDAFAAMELRIKAFFSEVTMMPEMGKMEIGGMRFRYSQSEGLATAFRETLTGVYGEKGAEQILYKLGKSLGAVEGHDVPQTVRAHRAPREACGRPRLFRLFGMGVRGDTAVQRAETGRGLHPDL